MHILNFLLIYLELIDYVYYSIAISLCTMFYYIVGYMQLFGYGLWGTFWREAFILLTIIFIQFGLIFAFFAVDFGVMYDKQFSAGDMPPVKTLTACGLLFMAVMTMLAGHVINLIATRKARKSL